MSKRQMTPLEMETNENQIYDALEKAGIPYEVIRREEGWLEIGFCVKEFNQGEFKDWYVERVGHKHWVIFHKEINQEWQDEEGNNLCFETKKEAVAHLKKVFLEEVIV